MVAWPTFDVQVGSDDDMSGAGDWARYVDDVPDDSYDWYTYVDDSGPEPSRDIIGVDIDESSILIFGMAATEEEVPKGAVLLTVCLFGEATDQGAGEGITQADLWIGGSWLGAETILTAGEHVLGTYTAEFGPVEVSQALLNAAQIKISCSDSDGGDIKIEQLWLEVPRTADMAV